MTLKIPEGSQDLQDLKTITPRDPLDEFVLLFLRDECSTRIHSKSSTKAKITAVFSSDAELSHRSMEGVLEVIALLVEIDYYCHVDKEFLQHNEGREVVFLYLVIYQKGLIAETMI